MLLSGGEETKKLCGQQLPTEYVSKDNVVNIRFISSSHQNQQKPGFIATYTSGSTGQYLFVLFCFVCLKNKDHCIKIVEYFLRTFCRKQNFNFS